MLLKMFYFNVLNQNQLLSTGLPFVICRTDSFLELQLTKKNKLEHDGFYMEFLYYPCDCVSWHV